MLGRDRLSQALAESPYYSVGQLEQHFFLSRHSKFIGE